MPKIAGNPQNLGRRKKVYTHGAFRGSMALLNPWFWTSGFQNYEKIKLYYCKPPSLRTLLQQLWETNTVPYTILKEWKGKKEWSGHRVVIWGSTGIGGQLTWVWIWLCGWCVILCGPKLVERSMSSPVKQWENVAWPAYLSRLLSVI